MRRFTYSEFVSFMGLNDNQGIRKKDLGEALMAHSSNLTNWGAIHKTGMFDPCQRVSHGRYMSTWSPENEATEPVVIIPESSVADSSEVEAATEVVSDITNAKKVAQADISLVPNKMDGFIKNTHFANISRIINSKQFFPIYLTGDTGCGKTLTVEQACAIGSRECIRLNFTEQTNESHIIGSYRIIDGETVWSDGPAITAMRRGAVLLLDEVDLGSPKMMCLQPILEGSSYYIERTGELVEPQEGFTIVATANTKGSLTSASRKFVGARVQNEAFLDRFAMTLEFPYPTENQETRILNFVAESMAERMGMELSPADKDFVSVVITWTRAIRDSYVSGSFDHNLSTRRAKDIVRSYFILNRKIPSAISGGIARFDGDTQLAFQQLFNSINSSDIDWGNVDSEEGEAES